jgi:hypothetical protein
MPGTTLPAVTMAAVTWPGEKQRSVGDWAVFGFADKRGSQPTQSGPRLTSRHPSSAVETQPGVWPAAPPFCKLRTATQTKHNIL